MSRLLIKPLIIPNNVSVSIIESSITVSSDAGLSESIDIPNSIVLNSDEKSLFVSQIIRKSSINGTFYANLKNIIKYIAQPFTLEIVMTGVEYKALVSGSNLFISVGYSHDLVINIKNGIKVSVSGQKILIQGNNKALVSQFASKIVNLKKTEPYGGKGISILGSFVLRKEVKSGK